jgi:hypothetical protein
VAGNMQVNQWTGRMAVHSRYQVVADSVISARTVRPGGKAGQQGQATDALRRRSSHPLMILTSAHHSTMKRHSEGDKHGKRQ